uniref:Uncharacterized protein n=1 Tax=Arundo donax TaxID=35708 RepID=A0A0A9BPG0_ARUDO
MNWTDSIFRVMWSNVVAEKYQLNDFSGFDLYKIYRR